MTLTFPQNMVLLLGRILFSLVFILFGFSKLTHFSENIVFLAGKGLPYPQLLAALAIIFELGGGIMVLLGWRTRIGALMLFLFVIIATGIVHTFWSYHGIAATNQMLHFIKNISILGGALFIMVFGAGAYSLDRES